MRHFLDTLTSHMQTPSNKPRLLVGGLFTLTVFLLVTMAFSAPVIMAQESEEERRERLREELIDIEGEIKENQRELQEKRSERRSLERDVEILTREIEQSQLEIRRKNLTIGEISDDITNKQQRIEELNQTINDQKQYLAELVRQQNELDQITLVEMILSNEDISEFFAQVDSFAAINSSLQDSFEKLRSTKTQVNEQKQVLGVKKDEEMNARKAIEEEKAKIEQKEDEKQELVAVKRSEERSYEQIIADRQAEAERIRTELFSLRGVQAIPFGDALRFAREAGGSTGVRPAFILAILQQESNLGQNVGTCNRPGDPESKKWYNIMKPSRDVEPYKRITGELGLSPDSMPLSCPWGNGWGGAMGPSQFIPSTWAMYKGRIANAVNVPVPNPWEPRHAFYATAIYMQDLGASAGTYTAERRAALQYYAGGNWHLPQNAFYGDQVMQKASSIQRNQIDVIDAAAQGG